MKDRKIRKLDINEVKAFKKRIRSRRLREEDYTLLKDMVNNLGLLRGAVEDDVDDETLERMLRAMFGDEA